MVYVTAMQTSDITSFAYILKRTAGRRTFRTRFEILTQQIG